MRRMPKAPWPSGPSTRNMVNTCCMRGSLLTYRFQKNNVTRMPTKRIAWSHRSMHTVMVSICMFLLNVRANKGVIVKSAPHAVPTTSGMTFMSKVDLRFCVAIFCLSVPTGYLFAMSSV